MATKNDLNTAITGLGSAVGAAATEIGAAFVRLEAKIAEGGEFQPEIDLINAQIAALQSLADAAKGKGN